MSYLICPVCRKELSADGKVMRCGYGHSYDIAKQGYVNLLMSNKSSAKRHGDDRAMVRARSDFLDKGYYNCLRDAVCDAAARNAPAGNTELVCDAGCGEGWYTLGVKDALKSSGKECGICGIDISREALIGFSKRDRDAVLVVAGVNSLPVSDGVCDIVLNIFAPDDPAEFYRILKPGGIVIRAIPLEDHLLGLKKAVYEKPYLNTVPEYAPEGFTLVSTRDVRNRLLLTDKDDIRALFMMTPYYYKTGRDDQEKLFSLDQLETEISFRIITLKKDNVSAR